MRVSEPGMLVVAVNGRWRKRDREAAPASCDVPHRGTVRGLTAYAIDLAGNQSRVAQRAALTHAS